MLATFTTPTASTAAQLASALRAWLGARFACPARRDLRKPR